MSAENSIAAAQGATSAQTGQWRDLAAIAVCTLAWGTTWYAITHQLGVVDPVVSVTYRFALAAGLRTLWRAQRWVAIGLAGYVALVLVWPIEPDRFVWGILPLIALVPAAGVAELLRRVGQRRLSALAVLVLVALPLGACGRWSARGYINRGWVLPQEIAARNAEVSMKNSNMPMLKVKLTRRNGSASSRTAGDALAKSSSHGVPK